MKLKLHHINFSTDNVARMDAFYRDILGLEETTQDLPVLEKGKGYAGDVAFVWDGAVQTHLAERDPLAGFKTGHVVNPVVRGHIAYRTDDLTAFKAHLEAKGILIRTGKMRRWQAGIRSFSTTRMATSSRCMKWRKTASPQHAPQVTTGRRKQLSSAEIRAASMFSSPNRPKVSDGREGERRSVNKTLIQMASH